MKVVSRSAVGITLSAVLFALVRRRTADRKSLPHRFLGSKHVNRYGGHGGCVPARDNKLGWIQGKNITTEYRFAEATKFEFIINLKGANQIGLTIPVRVLERANQVIR